MVSDVKEARPIGQFVKDPPEQRGSPSFVKIKADFFVSYGHTYPVKPLLDAHGIVYLHDNRGMKALPLSGTQEQELRTDLSNILHNRLRGFREVDG